MCFFIRYPILFFSWERVHFKGELCFKLDMHCLHRSNEMNCNDIPVVYVILAATSTAACLLLGSMLNGINSMIPAEDLIIIVGEF